MKTVNTITAASLFALVLGSSALYADDDIQEMKHISEKLGLITLDEAKAKALEAKPGVIEDADLEDRDLGEGWDYEFEIKDADGKEWEVYIDAKTGEGRKIDKDWF